MEESGEVGWFSRACWQARNETRRAWPSYPLNGLFFLSLGFLVVPSLSGVFELRGFGVVGRRVEGFYNAFFADCLFLVVCAFLAVNVASGDHARIRLDVFCARLHFLRKLPILAGSVVGSRTMYMLIALILGAPAFFLPTFFFSDLGELGASYLWFAGIWIGYSLLASGLNLLLELTGSGRTRGLTSYGLTLSFVLALAILEWTLDLNLVGRKAELAQSGYGALPAILSILTGAAAFAILARATASRLERRDLSA